MGLLSEGSGVDDGEDVVGSVVGGVVGDLSPSPDR